MIDGAVRLKLFPDAPIDTAFVGPKVRLPRGNRDDKRTDRLRRDVRDME